MMSGILIGILAISWNTCLLRRTDRHGAPFSARLYNTVGLPQENLSWILCGAEAMRFDREGPRLQFAIAHTGPYN